MRITHELFHNYTHYHVVTWHICVLIYVNVFIHFSEETEENGNGNPNQTPVLSDPISATRIFCGALFMPTVSAIVGRVFFESIQNNLHRTLIGGLSFIVVKGALKIYFKHKQHTRKKQRKILDFNDENMRLARSQQHYHSRNNEATVDN